AAALRRRYRGLILHRRSHLRRAIPVQRTSERDQGGSGWSETALIGSKAAGCYFPQVVAGDGSRLDDVLGHEAWLICRDDLGARRLEPFAGPLRQWLDHQGVDAVMVRPDHYAYRAGLPDDLTKRWQASMRSPWQT
ncbi:MAG: hypothetical protein ACKO1N_01385, partial [Erythrobacter sp.]